MCRCKEPITDNECRFLRKLHKDPRTFIYHISRVNSRLLTALVEKESPNQVALRRGFVDEKGNAEFYFTEEHPCINQI